MKRITNLVSLVSRQAVRLLLFGFFPIFIFGCDVDEIPDDDTTSPDFTLTIQGEGVNRTFTPRTDFSQIQLNLLKDATYQFTFLGVDAGGVERIALFGAKDFIDFSDLSSDVSRVENEFTTTISKTGDINNANTALNMSGNLEAIGIVNSFFTLEIEVSDFATPANSTFASLPISIVDDPDRVGL